ncbi:hypothetical protein C7444_10186 [Sphaerotilus hippei]|uniref:PsiF repeat-containing protein n=1 Tax=Sphaerotilus hippei TaxID=744406 RepID=A0A318H5M0_9BURK|nr:hypothetical protein [Sphaerotilus hippei]PXW99257.1 hypothetical protein C7444_10186 [Sphaerotilus hippei]
MKTIITIAALALASLGQVAYAADATCAEKAAEKKLAGAAKNSFVKKCEKDSGAAAVPPAQAACDMKAAEKKLAGAAKNSFVKKCVADAAK